MQCCNDVTQVSYLIDFNNLHYSHSSLIVFFNLSMLIFQERFAPELKYDVALRLAALHIHQHVVANNGPNAKVTIKAVE